MSLAAFDYSITCPCLCFEDSLGFTQFHFVTEKKMVQETFKSESFVFTGHEYPLYKHDTERFDKISDVFIPILKANNIQHCVVEGYSFGSKGKYFNIAENTGILKHKLFKNDISFSDVPPTTMKKFAVGKGNAQKSLLYEVWLKKTSVNLFDLFGIRENLKDPPSPVNDVVDSWFLMRYAMENY